MINKKQYCCEDISLIENYNEAINSDEMYDCHNRNEIILNKSADELIEIGLYYNRQACELIFLSHSAHTSLHRNGKHMSETSKAKISQNNARFWKGKHRSEETKKKLSDSLKGRPSQFKGKKRQYKSKPGPKLKHWKIVNGKRDYY